MIKLLQCGAIKSRRHAVHNSASKTTREILEAEEKEKNCPNMYAQEKEILDTY